MDLKEKIETHSAKVTVIGLGYVGLPLAVEYAQSGYTVTGFDVDEQKVDQVNRGRSYIMDIPDSQIEPLVRNRQLMASTSPRILHEADILTICVPTPLNKTKDPDVSFILSVTRNLKDQIRPGQLVILESTTYPGTTEELILPILEESGLKVGDDFYLAFSPERVDPGNKEYTIVNTPKIIGGVTSNCLHYGRLFYEHVVDNVIPVSNTRTAEMVKLLENTFRTVNIGLANEVAKMCDVLGIDVWEVIDASSTKPFGYMKFYPGPGIGGHCLPVDPHYLTWKLKNLDHDTRFIELAGEINASMPRFVVEKIIRGLNRQRKSINGSTILILGISYKKDIDDTRESPSLDVMRLLLKKQGKVIYNDPYVSEVSLENMVLKSQELTTTLLKSVDCAAITTNHSDYDYEMIVKNSSLIIDTRNATVGIEGESEKIIKL